MLTPHPEQHQKIGPGPGTSISTGVTNNEAAAIGMVPVEDPLVIDILRCDFQSMRIHSPLLEADVSSWVSEPGDIAKEMSNLSNLEELQASLSQCCIDYCTSYEIQQRVHHASKLLSLATASKMALSIIVDIGALNCPPENALWQVRPYLQCLEDLDEEFPVPCIMTGSMGSTSLNTVSDNTSHETRGLGLISVPALPTRSIWMPPTLIQTNFAKSHLKYRWWKSASDKPLRSPLGQDWRSTGDILNPLQFELGDVFIHRCSNPIQQTWILLREGWKDVSASFYMNDGTISHPLYRNRILIQHNAVGDPSFILRKLFKVHVSFRKRGEAALKKRRRLEL